MADPSNPADRSFSQGRGLVNADPHRPPPITSADSALGADADNEGNEQQTLPEAAPSVPAVGGRDDDHELERQKKHAAPARSWGTWLSYAAKAALTIAESAASTSSANPYDHVTPAPPCPLCGTPYQWGPSGWGPQRVPEPRDIYGRQQTRDGPQLVCYPACDCPIRTQLSPTDAPTRFLSSGRREYITGYPSSSTSQHHLGGITATPYTNTNNTTRPYRSTASFYGDVTTTGTSGQGYRTGVTTSPYTNTNNTTRPYGSAAGSYGDVTTTGTSGRGYQTESRVRERTPTATHTETRNYASTSNREYLANFAPVSIGGGGPVPAREQHAIKTMPPATSTPLPLNNNVTMSGVQPRLQGARTKTSTTPLVISTPLSSSNVTVTSQEGHADGANAAYSGSTNEALVSDMKTRGYIKSDAVADVMRAVDRSHYVTDKATAYSPATHLTEKGVAVAAPHIHAAILELILPYIKAGSHVLDVGASTGLFAAMLYHRTGKDGVTVSLSPSIETVELARQNLIADGLDRALQKGRILFVKGDEKSGYAPCAPYDVIHVTKIMEEIPPLLLTRLASPGRMVIPVRTDGRSVMIQVDKDVAGNVSKSAIRPPVRI